jgi:hypothetical protein
MDFERGVTLEGRDGVDDERLGIHEEKPGSQSRDNVDFASREDETHE